MPIIKKHGNTKRIENQAARLCGSKIAFPVTKPLSFYGPKHFYTQIFEMRNGQFLIVSMDDELADFAHTTEFPIYHKNHYDDHCTYDAICDAVGITRPGDLSSSLYEMSLGDGEY